VLPPHLTAHTPQLPVIDSAQLRIVGIHNMPSRPDSARSTAPCDRRYTAARASTAQHASGDPVDAGHGLPSKTEC
jgi:hypothetical protein